MSEKRDKKSPRHIKVELFQKHIGKVIKKHRTLSSHSQEDLGHLLGIQGTTVSRYERGECEIKASTMAKISDIYGFDLMEYVLLEGKSLSEMFRYVVQKAGVPLSEKCNAGVGMQDIGPRSEVYDMQFIKMDGNRTIFSGFVVEKPEQKKEDILTIRPDNVPLPLCDDDNRDFEKYMYFDHVSQRRRLLIYGYEIMKIYDDMDTSWNTVEAFAKRLLRKLILEPSGETDQNIYDYYWKCIYMDLRT